MSLASAERKAARLIKRNLAIDDLYERLEDLRDAVQALSTRAGSGISREYGRARAFAAETADEAEEVVKDHLAASLLLAIGIGVVIGYFIRRGTE